MWQRQGHARGGRRQGPQSVAGQSGAHQQGHWGIWSRCSCFGAAGTLATRRGGTGRALGGEKRTEMQVKAWGRHSDRFAFVATLTCGFVLLATHAAGHNAPPGLTDGTSTKICNVGGTLREASGVAMWMAGALEGVAARAEANAAAMLTATRVARATVGGNESLVPEEAKQLEREATRTVDTTRALRGQASRLAAISIATESAAATIAEWALLLAYALSGRNKNTCIDSTAITTVGQDKKSSAILTSKCDALYSDSAKKGFSPLTQSSAKDEVTRIIAALGKATLEGNVASDLTTDTGKHVGAKLHTGADNSFVPNTSSLPGQYRQLRPQHRQQRRKGSSSHIRHIFHTHDQKQRQRRKHRIQKGRTNGAAATQPRQCDRRANSRSEAYRAGQQ
ncbi:hypothetical protein, conserved in T. vivax [Trypanosoma vivax Y486]|uniref:Uncharacterized protein n=1 Tax=Trypanosoma vivax (strain Y486) TaxID=1055687 RepID=F9WTC0_TRYVY|nr:hypothetical protein, conserved in T. vivax [Trypanosoma vivax Y486]|eukprot:CCD20813.1 hypothetical protein, conserved in T. vivax [Trypanosoma vivax Y486]